MGPGARVISDQSKKAPKARSEDREHQLALEATLVDDSGASPRENPMLATMTLMREEGDLLIASRTSSSIAAFSPGYLLAERYRIRDRIGKGGFGFVYAADDLELDVTVAIKVLRPEVDGNREMVRRFKQEIQLARQVTHQNVCRIYDVGFYEFGDLRVPFLSMELLKGESLAERLKKRVTLPLDELKLITLQVASGLEAAHRVGIVHADLKPANIMLVGEGMETRAVVTDFGLASAHAAEVESNQDSIVGTPAYMAPEQVRGEALTPATDFYALGCTLYQAISGKLPFIEASILKTAEARLSGRIPRLRTAGGKQAAQWSGLVRDLMVLSPSKRLANAKEIRHRLRSTTSQRVALISLVVAVLVTGILAYVVLTRPPPTPGPPVFALSLPEDREALARYNEGLQQWEAFDGFGALETWENAVADGFGHPITIRGICNAYAFYSRMEDATACRLQAYNASLVLPADEVTFYKADYLRHTDSRLESVGLLAKLLAKYPDNYEINIAIGDVQRAQLEFHTALDTLQRIRPTNDRERVSVESYRIALLVQQKRYDEALREGPAGLDEAHSLGLARQELSFLESLAQANRNVGNLLRSRELGERRLALSKDIGSVRDEAESVSLLGAIAIGEHRFKDAEELLQRRASFLKRIGNEGAENQILITNAEIMSVTGRSSEAEEMLTNEALPRLRSKDNTYWEGYALLVRAGIRSGLGRGDEALEDCYAGEAIFRGLHLDRLEAYAKMVCGAALIEMGRLDDAERELAEAHKTRTELKLHLQVLQNDLMNAELLLARGMADKAYVIASDVADEYRRRGLAPNETSARELSARAALRYGNDEGARDEMRAIADRPRGEHVLLNLQLDLVNARLAFRADPSEANVAALQALIASGEQLGYMHVANQARRDVASDLQK